MRLLSHRCMARRLADWDGKISGGKPRESIAREVLLGLYDSSLTISKGQLMAPAAQTVSQSVHQSHSTVSIIVTILSTMARALQWHTPTHNPHPSHFSVSMIGISIMFFSVNQVYSRSGGLRLSVTLVSRGHLHYPLETFFVPNYYPMAVQLDHPVLL